MIETDRRSVRLRLRFGFRLHSSVSSYNSLRYLSFLFVPLPPESSVAAVVAVLAAFKSAAVPVAVSAAVPVAVSAAVAGVCVFKSPKARFNSNSAAATSAIDF